MTQERSKSPQNKESVGEIDLIAITKSLWEGRRKVIKTTLIFMGIGLFIAIFSQKEYTATTITIPQTADGNNLGGNLGSLAAMAGINLGGIAGDAGISPALYPQIVNSISFQKELLETSLTIKGQKNKISYNYYYTEIYSLGFLNNLKRYTIGLPGIIRSAITESFQKDDSIISSNTSFLSITKDEEKLINRLMGQVTIDFNDRDEYLTISAVMPEPLAATELAQNALELLQKYIVNFKILKSTEQLKFIEERYKEKELDFKKIQKELAQFRDRNKNMNTALAQTALEELQSEYDLAFSIYSSLAKQNEAYQLEVKQDTPVFMIIDPVSIPFEKSAPKRTFILFIWTFLGFVVSGGTILLKNYFKKIKEVLAKSE